MEERCDIGRTQVVVTGTGAVTPLGSSVGESWAALLAGRSGVSRVVGADDLPVRVAGQVAGFDAVDRLGVRRARQLDRFAQLAVVAAEEALDEAGLVPPEQGSRRWATVIGSGLGGIGTLARAVEAVRDGDRVSPYAASGLIANSAAASVARHAGAHGPALCPVTACAAGTDAIGLGADLIRAGRADVVLAGGADAPVTRVMLAAFAAMRAASTADGDPADACRPFDRHRDGMVLGEGAAVLLLESAAHAAARGAVPLAEVAGYGASNDAHHVASPRPDGVPAMAALADAVRDAGIRPADVDYVNAHGTGTRLNDEVEACVLAGVLGRVPTSSTKSMTGHLMGAAGAVEAVVCVQALRTGWLPATRNLRDVDPACAALDHVTVARHARPEVVVSTSFGFGGHNAALVLRRPPAVTVE